MAGNLLGQGFDEYVVKQINKRQEIYGSQNRTNEIIQYTNNKTAFLRLSSGTQVNKQVAGLTIKNSDYVLFNGISSLENGKYTQKAGITRKPLGTIDTTTAYGFGGLDYGQSPMPGLISANIKSLNRGALREGEISIKAFNAVQFDIIDALYLRLGHYVLLEWGWSSYYSNGGQYISDNPYDLSGKFMDPTNHPTSDDLLTLIGTTRKESNGNYDAFFAKIINFSWSRASDGTYDIGLKVRGVGDVIESLKVNVLTEEAKEERENENKDENKDSTSNSTYPLDASSQEIIRSAASKNSLGRYFSNTYRNIRRTTSNIATYSDPELEGKNTDFVLVNYNYPGWDGDDRELYIRLGSLLQWMENNVILTLEDNKKSTYTALSFDLDVEKNLMYIDDLQLPVDPRICIFNKNVTLSDGTVVELFPGIQSFLSDITFNNNQYGQIMNIYLNCGFLLKKIDEQKDKDGNTSLIAFLNSVVSEVNVSIGGNNRLEATIDPENEKRVIIIDNNQLPDADKIIEKFGLNKETAEFEVYGYRNNKAGFIKSFEFKTEITPQMSSMITIGGTSNGNTSHEDSTALSAINAGTVNLYAEKARDNKTTTETTDDEDKKTLEERYKKTIENFDEFVKNLGKSEPEYDPEDVDSYKSALQQMVQYKEAKANESKTTDEKKSGSRNIGFIPFNLTLSMEGLSGIKIYQKYSTDSSFLPSAYPDALNFLTKGVSHKIEGNIWETTLESLAVPKNSSTPEPQTVRKGLSGGGASASSSSTNVKCPTPYKAEIPPPQNPTSPTRRNAIIRAYKYTFYNDGKSNQPKSHLCSKYTYTHAYNYTRVLNKKVKDLKAGGSIAAGGNANQSSYWNNLVKLGYTQTQIARGITKSDILSIINSTSYNYGDVLVYWATGNPYDGGASQYGHTQIYIGGAVSGVIWASDRYTNYNNSPFPYRSQPYNCWNLLLFRAPNV